MSCTSYATISYSSSKLYVLLLLLFLLLLFSPPTILCDTNYPSLVAHAASEDLQPQTIAALCNTTTRPHFCLATLSKYPSSKPSANLQDLTAYVVARALKLVYHTYSTGLNLSAQEDATAGNALQDCLELLDDSVEPLNSSVHRLSRRNTKAPLTGSQIMDVRVWLSSALTFMDTCWDELSDPAEAAAVKAQMSTINLKIEPLLGMAMVMAARLEDSGGASMDYELPGKRRQGRGGCHG